MRYKITTSWSHYKEWPHTRRLQKIWFTFKPINDMSRFKLWYDCKIENHEITKDMSSDEVIKLSHKHSIILYGDTIKIYDDYIE